MELDILQKRISKRAQQTNIRLRSHEHIERNDIKEIITPYIRDGYKYQIATSANGKERSATTFTKNDFDTVDNQKFGEDYVFDESDYYDLRNDYADNIDIIYLFEIKI